MNIACHCTPSSRRNTPHSTGLGWPWPEHPACDHTHNSPVAAPGIALESDCKPQSKGESAWVHPSKERQSLISDRCRILKQYSLGFKSSNPKSFPSTRATSPLFLAPVTLVLLLRESTRLTFSSVTLSRYAVQRHERGFC